MTRRLLAAVTSRVPRLVLEIVAGVMIGPSVLGLVRPTTTLHHVADTGAALLLFMVGMHVDADALRSARGAATRVALVGIVAPVVGGMVVGMSVGESWRTSLFLGAALSATSIGITARVFRDAGQLDSPEAHVVIGAAVIDDVLGLALLAVVTIVASDRGFDMGTALSSVVIIGSFFAGMTAARSRVAAGVESSASRLATVVVPLFFVHVGLKADLSVVSSAGTLLLAVVVLLVAMATKLVAGTATPSGSGDRVAIGLAMAPRGEVGLIFATTALAAGAFDAHMYAVVVLVVLGTTILTPVALRRRLSA